MTQTHENGLADLSWSGTERQLNLTRLNELKEKRLASLSAYDYFEVHSTLNQKMRGAASRSTTASRRKPEKSEPKEAIVTPIEKDSVATAEKKAVNAVPMFLPKITEIEESRVKDNVNEQKLLVVQSEKIAPSFPPRIEAIVRKQSPVLLETYKLFQSLDGDVHDHKKVFKSLVNTIQKKKYIPKIPNAELVNQKKWSRLANSREEYQLKERIQKEKQRLEQGKEHTKQNVSDLSTEDVLHRIMVGLSHDHPSEVKRMFQEIDRKTRAVKEKATVQDIIQYCSQSPDVTRPRLELLKIEEFLRSQPVFQDKPDYIISQLAVYLVSEVYQEGQVLFRQGDPGTRFYYILTGRIRLSVNKPGASHMDTSPTQNFLTIIHPREKLGDYALLNDTARTTTATAIDNNTAVLALEKSAFLRLMSVAHQVDIRFNVKVLKKFPLLANIDMQGLKIIAEKFYSRIYAPNSIIIEENQLVESVFFIKSGRCAIFKDIWISNQNQRIKKTVLLGHLGPNSTFNEESAVLRRTAKCHSPFTVVSVDAVEIGSVVSSGEWLELDLNYRPSIFVSMSNDELVRRYRIAQNAGKFRTYQNKYLKQLIKESNKKSFLNSTTVGLSEVAAQ